MGNEKETKKRFSGEDRRAQIIDVALSLFADKGYNGTKTREITEKAGVSESILYRYFKSKEELYRVALGELLEVHSISVDFKKAMENRDDYRVFGTFASHVIDYYYQDPRSIRLILFSALEGSPISGAFRPVKEKTTIELLADYIQQRTGEGAFCKLNAHLVSQLFIEAMVMFIVDKEASLTAPPARFSNEEAIDTMAKIFVDGLKADAITD